VIGFGELMTRYNYDLPPRSIVQRSTFAWGYMNWLWHKRHPVELCRNESRRSQWQVVRVWSDRPPHPAYRGRRDRIPKEHWRRFRQPGFLKG